MQHSVPTWLLCPRERASDCVARLLASSGEKLPLRDLIPKRSAELDSETLGRANEMLARAELFMCTGRVSAPRWYDDAGDRALVVDDADLAEGVTSVAVRERADDGALVIAALPRHMLVEDRHPDGDLTPDWARAADVIVEIRTKRLAEAVPGERLGEATLTVLKHRRGPTMVTTLSFRGHYARFEDLA